jgi:hypothetical protein
MEKKTVDGPLYDFDLDDYDTVVEIAKPENKEQLVEGLDLANADGKDLLVYFANRFKETHGYEYTVEWVKEVAIFKSYKERYKLDSGPMIAVLFDKYRGLINGAVMTATAFSKGSKWIQDLLYIDVQQARIKEETKPSTEGLMGTDEFLQRFSV